MTKNEPGGAKISVIIPVYNGEKYLAECLDSVIAQTFAELEIICVNDGSTDASLAILRDYAARDARIVIVDYGANKWLPYARNRGLERARGKYVYFLDADDMIKPNAMAELFALAEEDALDGVLFDTEPIFESERLYKLYGDAPYYRKKNVYDGVFVGARLFAEIVWHQDYSPTVWIQFWRREFLVENNIFFNESLHPEDELFTFQAVLFARRIKCVNKTFHFYRRHEGAITARAATPMKNIEDFKNYFIIYHERAESYAEAKNGGLIPEDCFVFYDVFFISEYRNLQLFYAALPPNVAINFADEKYRRRYIVFERNETARKSAAVFITQLRHKKPLFFAGEITQKARAQKILAIDDAEYVIFIENRVLYFDKICPQMQNGSLCVFVTDYYGEVRQNLIERGFAEYSHFIDGRLLFINI